MVAKNNAGKKINRVNLPVMKFLRLFLLLATLNNANAQDSALHPLSTGAYLKSYFTNGVQLLTSPLHWQKKDWLMASGTVAITTGIYLVDGEINKPFKRWQSSPARSFGNAGNALGPPLLIGSSLIILGTGIVAHKPGLINFAQDNLQAQLYTGGITFLAKGILGRERVGDRPHYWAGPFQFSNNRYQSFFSGHSSIAFATATSVYLHSHKKWWVGVVSYGMATSIGISRMQRQAHWASDVLFGAVVGTAVSSFVYHQNQQRRKIVSVKVLP